MFVWDRGYQVPINQRSTRWQGWMNAGMLDLWVCSVKAPLQQTDPPSKPWWCKFNKTPRFSGTPQLPTGRDSAPPSVTLCGCSNYPWSCYLYKPIKHLLMMILLLDQWGKLTYRKPGFLTSQPGFVSPQEMASCICAALFQKRVCLLQTVLNIHLNV